MAHMKTDEQFRAELPTKNEHYPEGFALMSPYKGVTAPIECRCLRCGKVWKTKPHCLLKNSNCPRCAGVERIDDEAFRARLAACNRAFADGDFEVIGRYTTRASKLACRCLREGCGRTWEATAGSLLSGTGCPSCAAGRSTSRTQEFLAEALRVALGEDAVVSRDREAIGRELDIYIPGAGVAVEPGSLRWHKDIAGEAREKVALCEQRSIVLVGFTEDCGSAPRPDDLPERWGWYRGGLFSEQGRGTLKRIAEDVARLCGSDCDFSKMDWDAVAAAASRRAKPRGAGEFLEELSCRNVAYAAGEFVVSGPYLSDRDKLECECAVCGNKWRASAGSLLQGSACPEFRRHPGWVSPRQLSHEEFVERVAAANPLLGEGFRITGTFAGRKALIECECLVGHGAYITSAESLLQGCGCPECGRERTAAARRKTHQQYMSQLDERNPHYDHGRGFEVLTRYKSDRSRIKCRCLRDGTVWEPVAGSLISKKPTGCPECGRERTAAARCKK